MKKYICGYLHQGEIYHHYVEGAQEIETNSVIGKRMLEQTLYFLFTAVMHQLYPEVKVKIEHSFSHGVYIQCTPMENVQLDNVMQMMHQCISEQTKVIQNNKDEYQLLNLKQSFYDALCEDCAQLTFTMKPLYKGVWLSRQDQFESHERLFAIYQEFEQWGQTQGVTTLQELNEWVNTNRLNELVLISEAMAERKLIEISNQIVEQNKRFVLIAGPSSAGKTTTSKRLAVHLKVLGKNIFTIAMDDFYKNRVDTPKKADGSYDFECVEAIDLQYFQQVLSDMLLYKPVKLPIFDFKSGTRQYREDEFVMKENTIVIIEGIHGLNPIMKQYIDMSQAYRLYINALTHLNIDDHNYIMTTDYRLIRRIARDQKTRGRTAEEIILAKESVAEGENKYIYPYQEESDSIMNTSLMYELAILKKEVEPVLLKVDSHSKAAYDAKRLLKILQHVQAGDASCIPRSSVLQEFLVNSIFEETNI